VSSLSVLAEESELIRYQLQCFIERVGCLLARAEAIIGRLPTIVSPLAKPPVGMPIGSESGEEAHLYGCLSPRGSPSTSSLPVGPPTVVSEAIVGVVAEVAPVL
jgi:hypothetical protein